MMIDTHAHVDMDAFDEDREATIQRALDSGVKYILNIGCDVESSQRSVELAEYYDFIYATAGVHPHDTKNIHGDTYDHLRILLDHPKVIALGEIGLDYFKNYSPQDVQRKHFRKQIELAKEVGKPIIIHSRDARPDMVKILSDYYDDPNGKSGIFHCFSDDQETAEAALAMGFYISFAGTVTFKNADNLRAIARTVPADRLFAETDCPFMAPVPKRGKRNEPAYVNHTAEKLAEVRGVRVEDVERTMELNFHDLFGIGRAAEPGTISYQIRNSLYLNLTQRCTANCTFCTRLTKPIVQGYNLELKREPTPQEVWESIDDVKKYNEIVFCGYGEPTLRLDVVKEVAKKIKDAGGRVRLNTNGHGNVIHKRNILPELKGLIDEVSISLNADNSESYDEVVQPLPSFRGMIYDEVKKFIAEAKKYIPDVQATIVTHQEDVNEAKCEDIAKKEFGVNYRPRRYNIVG
ncbi:MAG: YchF/TatD family DNA exonuclease [Nitrospinaceae bacterium]|nr:YchF/TatD family DNA exonuclease [Nitrospinaceae bacterium]NIR55964.1 YchF/TatD family DNA exonuclease [Nitrospinaceae bacterium]NIS86407.1 YchF/TatD family DNA exonuclease [Nitrospinaceae bacterium]NIT83245.1 YchF/TatD family DNA exonuclease [Nitrospinaceae bacterium]NIU45452.1 YchF/TatD family DNA exonuclease [Nitrospinaceae bacterium]